jgi:nitric oxide reductase subunit C
VKRWLVRVVLASTFVMGDPTAWDHDDLAATRADPARGGEVFAKLPCGSCHDITRPWPGGEICPNLGNIASEAARIIKLPTYRGKARDAAGYIRESITDPNAYIVPGQNYRTPQGDSVMPRGLASSLTRQELDDLVAFLMSKR